MKRINNILCFIWASVVLMGCYPTSGIEDGEKLYIGQEPVQYTTSSESGNTDVAKADLEVALATAPNGAIFSSSYRRWPFSFPYIFWNWTHNSKKGFGHWVNMKLSSPPVLITDVNPILHTTVATSSLKNNGYFHGSVDYREIAQSNPKKARLQYLVNFGPLFKLDSIEYRGFPEAMQQLISSSSNESLLHKGDGFSSSNLDNERQRIASLFRSNGYYFYRPEHSSYLADTLQNPLHVQLRLQPQDSLDSRIMRPWTIGRTHILLKRYGERTTTDSIQKRRLTIHFNGKRPPVAQRILLNSMQLKRGMLYDENLYKETVNRLSKFDAFSNIDLSCVPSNPSDTCSTLDIYMDCTLDKLWGVSLEGNITGKTSSRIGPGANLTVTRKNPFRGAEKLSFNVYGSYEWQYGGKSSSSSLAKNSYEYGYGVTLEMPSLLVPKFIRRMLRNEPSTSFKLTNSVIKRGDFFNRHIISGEIAYTYHPNSYQEHRFSPIALEFSYLNKHSEQFDSLIEENPHLLVMMEDKFIPQMKYSFTYTSRGKHINPITWSFTIAEAGNLISLGYMCAGRSWQEKYKNLFKNPYEQFLKFETDFTKSWRITDHSSFLAHANFGIFYTFGNSEYPAYSEQFYVGGANSVRAFTARSIGPGDYKDDGTKLGAIAHTGDLKLVGNLEYRPRIFGNLYGAIFLDVGNVWMLPHSINGEKLEFRDDIQFRFKNIFKDLAMGTGIGLRYDLSFFVLRLDWGIALHVPYNTGKSGYFNMNRFKDAQCINIAIGYPF